MRREVTTNRPSWNGRSRGEVGRGQERERERNEAARVRGGVDAKYRQGCQVAETAAAPLSTGTSWFSPAGCRRGRQGMNRTWRSGAGSRQGRVIDRGWKGWRRDAPSDVIACSNPLGLPAGALSFATPGPSCDLLPRLLPRPDTQPSVCLLSSLASPIFRVKVLFFL